MSKDKTIEEKKSALLAQKANVEKQLTEVQFGIDVDEPFERIKKKIQKISNKKEHEQLKAQLLQQLNTFQQLLKREREAYPTLEPFHKNIPVALESAIDYLCDSNTTMKQKRLIIEKFRSYAQGLGENNSSMMFAMREVLFSAYFPEAVLAFVIAFSLKSVLALSFFGTFGVGFLILAALMVLTAVIAYVALIRNDHALMCNEKDYTRGQELCTSLKTMVDGKEAASENANVNENNSSFNLSFFPAAPEPEPTFSNVLFPPTVQLIPSAK